MTRKQFDEWVEKMVSQYKEDENILIRLFGSETYVAYNFKTQKTSIARCHPKDSFVNEIGQAIAYARCKGIEVPKIAIYKKLSEMKNGEYFIDDYGHKYCFFARDKARDYFVVFSEKTGKYATMPYDVEYEMVE